MGNKGLVLKVISQYCYVLFEKDIFTCKAAGNLRLKNQRVLTGDWVLFDIISKEDYEGIIKSIFERKNELYRPTIANIDQVVIVNSLFLPNFNSLTLNKYLSIINYMDVEIILLFTKIDQVKEKEKENILYQIDMYKKMGYKTFILDNENKNEPDWNDLIKLLNNKISVFTGQSGAGKTTTLNRIIPNIFEKTQEISIALGRGKHTTTKNEIFIYKDLLIADTPGFSSFENLEMTPTILASSFVFDLNKEYVCKFKNCIHDEGSTGCKVIEYVSNKLIPEFIYKDYLKILDELTNNNKRKGHYR